MSKYRFSRKDTLNACSLITEFVAPLLRKFRKHSLERVGAYSTVLFRMQEMLPEHMRIPDTVTDWGELEEYNDLLWEQWVWVLDEIVWAFNTFETLDKRIGTLTEEEDKRLEHSMKLFGAAYLSLWR